MDRDRRRDWAVTIAFFLLLATPLTAQLLGADAKVAHAARPPSAEAPAVPETLAGWFALPQRLDDHLADAFGLREPMVRTFSRLKFALGDSANESVLIGRDGWLYLTANRALEQHRGLDLFSDAELDAWVAALESLERAVTERGARFVFVVAPNKHTIYPEHLPRWARRFGPTTRHDQLYRHLADRTGIRHVDLRPLLTAAKQDHQVYFRQDTHWNSFGGFLAYRAIMRAANDPRIDSLTLQPADVEPETIVREGDLTRMLGIEDILTEPGIQLEVGQPPRRSDRREIVRYPGAPPDTATIHVVETGRPARPRILFIGDSFSEFTAAYFVASADGYVWTHHRFGAFDLGLIDQYRPDLVVFQIVERYLGTPLHQPIGLAGPGPG